MYKSLCILAICCFGFGVGYNWREGIQLCHRSSPDFLKCLETGLASGLYYFRDGDKNLNIPRIDPLEMQPFEVKTAGSQVALRLNFKKPYIGGMSNSTITHVELDVDKDCYWKLDVITPALTLFGEYEIAGKLMMFELNGHGKCNITALETVHRHTMKCRRFKRKGNTYIKIHSYHIDGQPSRVLFDFEKLVPTSDEITKAILQTFNGIEESLLIYKEVGPSVNYVMAEMHKKTMNRVFNILPVDEMFLK